MIYGDELGQSLDRILSSHKTIVFIALTNIDSFGPKVIKLFSCSTQLSTKIKLLIKLKYRQLKKCLALSFSDVVLIMLINVKMPAINLDMPLYSHKSRIQSVKLQFIINGQFYLITLLNYYLFFTTIG